MKSVTENLIGRLADEGRKNFSEIDIDNNGFLNLLELKNAAQSAKLETTQTPSAPQFLATNYQTLLDFEDDNIYLTRRADTKRNNYGLSPSDLETLSLLSSGKKQDLIRQASLAGSGYGAMWGGIAGIKAMGLMAIAEVAGPLPALVFLGAPIVGAAVGFAIERYRAKNYYADKESQVKALTLKPIG